MWRHLASSGLFWPHLASSGASDLGGSNFQKNPVVSNKPISLCKVISKIAFWGLGWPRPFLGGSGATRQKRFHEASFGLIWPHLVSSGFIWGHLASSGLIWLGGMDFQKNERTILQLISLCETFDLEPFWGLGWPGTLLEVSG